MMGWRNNYTVTNWLGLEIYFLWGIKREGRVKAAPMFCCLGETVNLEETQGANKDEDDSMGPVEFNCNGVDT